VLIFSIRNEDVRSDVEAALGVRFEPHDSLYLGEYWLAVVPDRDTALKVRWNRDPLWRPGDADEERFAFPEHSQHEWLLEVHDETPELSDKLRGLPSLRLLQPVADRSSA
jgi:hypothetical protein